MVVGERGAVGERVARRERRLAVLVYGGSQASASTAAKGKSLVWLMQRATKLRGAAAAQAAAAAAAES